MTQHFWTVLTKKTHIDQDTNALILGEILEDVRLDLPVQMKEKFEEEIKDKKKILLPFEYELASFLGTDEPNQKLNLLAELEMPDGSVEKIGELEISTGDTGRVRNRIRSNGLFVANTGMYWFKLYSIENGKKKKLAEVPLKVTVQFV